MTRQEIERDYSFHPNTTIICTPGMFEGEQVYVPYYWDAYMNGFADRDNGNVLGFDVTTEDKAMFPELRKRRTVKLMQRSDGFVCEV